MKLSKLETRLLIGMLGCTSLYTSDHKREYVRLSAAGLVERRDSSSWMHSMCIEPTEQGRAKAKELLRADPTLAPEHWRPGLFEKLTA